MNVRQFTEQELAAVLAIQSACPEAAQRREEDYTHLARDPAGLLLIAESEAVVSATSAMGREEQILGCNSASVLGFAAFCLIADEAELRNLAVAREHRQRGVGRALLDKAHGRLRRAWVKRVYLEVRASNNPAIGLYASMGYSILSTRNKYYPDPPEDAYVWSLDL